MEASGQDGAVYLRGLLIFYRTALSHGTTTADQNQGPHITRVIGMKGKTLSLFGLHKSI